MTEEEYDKLVSTKEGREKLFEMCGDRSLVDELYENYKARMILEKEIIAEFGIESLIEMKEEFELLENTKFEFDA